MTTVLPLLQKYWGCCSVGPAALKSTAGLLSCMSCQILKARELSRHCMTTLCHSSNSILLKLLGLDEPTGMKVTSGLRIPILMQVHANPATSVNQWSRGHRHRLEHLYPQLQPSGSGRQHEEAAERAGGGGDAALVPQFQRTDHGGAFQDCRQVLQPEWSGVTGMPLMSAYDPCSQLAHHFKS